ncbi:MAG: hypothetical protein LBQ98_05765 [Nitrososphaerota archaeon]|nr:hypothetical protein [Nitrososphaerota archaeon]
MCSTYEFYLENPADFRKNERNKIFSYLTTKFGFRNAGIIFSITFEIPLLVFFSVLPLQTLYSYMFPNTIGLTPCVMAGFGISAVGHLQAALKNISVTQRDRVWLKHSSNSYV